MATKKAAIVTKGDEVHNGVKVAEVAREKLEAYLVREGDLPKGAAGTPIPALLDRYAAHVQKLHKAGAKFIKCDQCLAASVDTLDECPVCGNRDEEENAETGIVKGDREKELDQSVSRIRGYIADAFKSSWELGHELDVVRDKKLWLERKDERGKPVHKSWADFTKHELGMSRVHANNMMLVAKSFTREDVQRVGFTKLQHIAKLDAEDKTRLLESAKNDVGLRDLLKDVRIVKPSTSRPAVGGGGKAGRKPPAAAPEPSPTIKGGVTVVFKITTVELKLEKGADGILRCKEEFLNGTSCLHEFNPKTCVLKKRYVRE